MKQPTPLLISLSILALGQLTLAQSAKAQANLSDITGDNSATNSSIINSTFTGGDFTGSFDSSTESFDFNSATGATGDFGISPEVVNLIPNVSLNDSFGNNNTTSGDGSSGALGTIDNSTTGVGTNDNSTTGQDGVLNEVNSSEIVICASAPCLPSEDGGKAITLNDLAKLIEEDLSRSLNDLAAAESLEQVVANQPRRIVRRSSNNCISPAVEARREVTTKLEQYRDFVEQMEKLKPDNSIW
ncbi:MAG: hypothetical protein QNJ70_01540 [Xenococcaceae cyanobacterium MO_207.B15]|nr:hypothetical protein [Xenococcaceae cyanobacterium MO_207.B15]MDJ0742312.1 hypothetical protein [Xenococcaceae cyanobacterium MO_167.B27]